MKLVPLLIATSMTLLVARDKAKPAKGPVQASVEIINAPDELTRTINPKLDYLAAFQSAFRGKSDPVNFNSFAAAMAGGSIRS